MTTVATDMSETQTAHRLQIEIWSDIACPWCFIGKRRLEEALAQFPHRDRVDITWRSFQLDPQLPARFDGAESDYLHLRRGIPRQQVQAMFAHTTAQARTVGLHYDFDRVVVANSLPAHQLLHLARKYGVADAVKEALLTARFLTGDDTGDVATLVRIGSECGIPAGDVRSALQDGTYLADVRAEIADAHHRGISGVPYFVLGGGSVISGAQTVPVFAAALAEAWNSISVSPQAGTCGPDGCSV